MLWGDGDTNVNKTWSLFTVSGEVRNCKASQTKTQTGFGWKLILTGISGAASSRGKLMLESGHIGCRISEAIAR